MSERERRIRMGAIDFEFDPDPKEWSSLDDLMDCIRQETQEELDAIIRHSSFAPTRIVLRWNNDGGYDYPYHPELVVYGYRPETAREKAARQRKAKAKRKRKAEANERKKQKELKLLEELKAKYE